MVGKLLGGLLGFLLFGPFGLGLVGLVVGVMLGHRFDRALGQMSLWFDRAVVDSGPRSRAQNVFFEVTFGVMGHIAKSDGRVSEHEIRAARSVMAQMRLTPELRKKAIEWFNRGKQRDYQMASALARLKASCAGQHAILYMFVEIQVQAAHADGPLNAEEQRLLAYVCRVLGVGVQFGDFDQRFRGEQSYQHRTAQARSAPSIQDAYRVLGISSSASDTEVKKAYRRLMNQHHPDKLVAQGLPEEMLKLATQKTQSIKAAYDRIRTYRGIQ